MIKKVFLILIFFSLLLACGKKADPEYKGQSSITFNTKTSKV